MVNIVDMIDRKWEYNYFSSIVSNLDIQSDLDVVFMKWDQDIPKTKNKNILFVTSDEHHIFHDKFISEDNTLLVFRNYLPARSHPKIKGIPLGYLNGFENHNINFTKRKYDYSFSGTLPDPPCLDTRYRLKSAISRLRNDKMEKFILFYGGWANGMSMKEYSNIMNETRIALCPMGYTSSETFRFFEAASVGCVIISEPKPDVWYYKDSPHIEINDWLELPALLKVLLNDKDRLIEHHIRTKKWWKETCSPMSVANYIKSELNNIGYK